MPPRHDTRAGLTRAAELSPPRRITTACIVLDADELAAGHDTREFQDDAKPRFL